jgi:hypothetical protein
VLNVEAAASTFTSTVARVTTVAVAVSDVGVGEGLICIVVSSAWALSAGENIIHKVSSSPISPVLMSNDLINPSPLDRQMSVKIIIPFYYTKKRASTWLTLSVVGLITYALMLEVTCLLLQDAL